MSYANKIEFLHALERVREKIKTKNSAKLHIGCGTVYKEGWINIDNNSDGNIQMLDLNWDLRNPLPFDDNSIDYIFNEHFLEHLTVEEGQRALKDFLRVLKPQGIMRIAMPDLESIVAIYNDPNWKEKLMPFLNKFGLGFIESRAELININFRAWGHQWLYDWEELERRLKQAGYKEVVKMKIHHSTHSELCNLETRNESTLIAEARKEESYSSFQIK